MPGAAQQKLFQHLLRRQKARQRVMRRGGLPGSRPHGSFSAAICRFICSHAARLRQRGFPSGYAFRRSCQ